MCVSIFFNFFCAVMPHSVLIKLCWGLYGCELSGKEVEDG